MCPSWQDITEHFALKFTSSYKYILVFFIMDNNDKLNIVWTLGPEILTMG